MELKGKKINILGDSITEGVGASCKENSYADVLADLAQFGLVRNYGISGTRIANQRVIEDITKDYDSFCQRYDKMDDDADIVIVFGGTNDYGHGDAPFGSMTDRTADTYCGAVHVLMQGLIRKYPLATIVFLAPMQRTGGSIPNVSNARPLKDYVDVIKEAAAQYSIPVLDLYKVSGMQPSVASIKEKYMPDGLHPNDEGHKKLAFLIEKFLTNTSIELF